jgi:hypothetical protein
VILVSDNESALDKNKDSARLRQWHSAVGELAPDLKMAHGEAGVAGRVGWSTNIQLTGTYLKVKQGRLQANMRQSDEARSHCSCNQAGDRATAGLRR